MFFLSSAFNTATTGKTCRTGRAIKIDMLPDDVFLLVFDFCMDACRFSNKYYWWHGLAHVCRRWRQLIFASPRRLNLQLHCSGTTPALENLGLWPEIPIVIDDRRMVPPTPLQLDNLFAALEHPSRVRGVTLHLRKWELKAVVMKMQRPFPELTYLQLKSVPLWDYPESRDMPIPVGFLCGSAPCLREIDITGAPFPSLPTLLLSTSHLTNLRLNNVTKTSSILPGAMVTGLAATTRLESLTIEFCLPAPRYFIRGPTIPPGRATLPALTRFQYCGGHEYLEDFVARLDTPRLLDLRVQISGHVIDPIRLQLPQLFQFIDRAEYLEPTCFSNAHVYVANEHIQLHFDSSLQHPTGRLSLKIWYYGGSWQAHSTGQLFIQSSAMVSTVRSLSIGMLYERGEYIADAALLGLLRSFIAVEILHVDEPLAIRLAPRREIFMLVALCEAEESRL